MHKLYIELSSWHVLSTQVLPCLHTSSCTRVHTHTRAQTKKSPHTHLLSKSGRKSQRCDGVWLLVRLRRERWMDRARMTVRKTDKEERERAIRVSRSDAVTHLLPHLVTFLSPHAITLSPHVHATLSPIPLATESVSPLSCDHVHPWPFVSFIHATEKRAEAQEGGQLCPDMPITLDHRPPT